MRDGDWYELLNALGSCGDLCAATGRPEEAITAWAAWAALSRGARLIQPDDPVRQEHWQETSRSRPGADSGRRGTRSGVQPGHRGRVRTHAHHPGPADAAAGGGPGQLSVRERELVVLVAQGLTDAQIAAQLYISIRTVRSHLDRIRDKTGCRRRADLTRLALAADLL